jgi:hypothetical protein
MKETMLIETPEELERAETTARRLNDIILQIETAAADNPLSPFVRSRLYEDVEGSAVNDLPELRSFVRKCLMAVIEYKISCDPSEVNRQREIMRQTRVALAENRRELDDAGLGNELRMFDDFARGLFVDVMKIIDAARTKEQKGF